MVKEKGVTFIELLTITIIITILAILGMVQYRKIVPKAKASKAKHALALIAAAEKMYKLDYGQYYRVLVAETIDGEIGSGVTGMNLTAVDNDANFKYSVSPAYVIKADNPAAIGTCPPNSPIEHDLSTGVTVVPACYK